MPAEDFLNLAAKLGSSSGLVEPKVYVIATLNL